MAICNTGTLLYNNLHIVTAQVHVRLEPIMLLKLPIML